MGRLKLHLHLLLTWALDGGNCERQARPLSPREKGPFMPIKKEAGWAPQPSGHFGETENSLEPNHYSSVLQTVWSHYTDWAVSAARIVAATLYNVLHTISRTFFFFHWLHKLLSCYSEKCYCGGLVEWHWRGTSEALWKKICPCAVLPTTNLIWNIPIFNFWAVWLDFTKICTYVISPEDKITQYLLISNSSLWQRSRRKNNVRLWRRLRPLFVDPKMMYAYWQ